MKYYPICLRVAGRPCLVIGGGAAAGQKVDGLLRAGAAVTVISPDLTARLAALASRQAIRSHARAYRSGDVQGFFLVVAATDDHVVQAAVARDATAAGVLLNVVDRPELCDFIMPAVLERGDLLVAASTSGASPAMAHRIRRQLEGMFGPEYDAALQVLRRVRERVLQSGSVPDHQQVFAALVNSPLLEYLRAHDETKVDELLAATVGDGVSLASLGVELTQA
jgi:precorrin-2 dehydrogenase / sirohydrochlorin ferrochelatase